MNSYKNQDDEFYRNSKLMFHVHSFVHSFEMFATVCLPDITAITGMKIFSKEYPLLSYVRYFGRPLTRASDLIRRDTILSIF